MTSGLQVGNFQGSKNWVKFILVQPIIHKPGSTFQYNSGDSHLLSAIIQKISGIPTVSFAEKYLFHPLGINKYTSDHLMEKGLNLFDKSLLDIVQKIDYYHLKMHVPFDI